MQTHQYTLIHIVYSLILVLFLASCEDTPSSTNGKDSSNNGWIVPKTQIVDGGTGRGGIPAINNPRFLDLDEVIYMDSTDLVIGVKAGNEIKAYPHKILNWHEIVNDEIGPHKLALTYCPLTGTGIGWNRTINDTTLSFGVSGLIYKNNLIPFDRATKSHWSQMLNLSIEGPLAGTKVEIIDVVETQWSTWKKAYPNSKVLSKNTGFTARYSIYPYGDYKSDHDQFLFPRPFKKDDRLPAKTRVHGIIIGSQAKTYPIKSFGDSLRVINDEINGKPVVVFGSQQLNLVESYGRTMDNGTTLRFEPVHGELPVVMKDQEGNYWTMMGKAVKGPRKGAQLPTIESYNGFWFAFVDFFRGVRLYQGNS